MDIQSAAFKEDIEVIIDKLTGLHNRIEKEKKKTIEDESLDEILSNLINHHKEQILLLESDLSSSELSLVDHTVRLSLNKYIVFALSSVISFIFIYFLLFFIRSHI